MPYSLIYNNVMYSNFGVIIPEIFLLILAIIVQLSSLFFRINKRIITCFVFIACLFLSWYCLSLYNNIANLQDPSFSMAVLNSLTSITKSINNEALLIKSVIAFLGGITAVLYLGYTEVKMTNIFEKKIHVFNNNFNIEFLSLLLFTIIGTFIIVSAKDIMLLYLGLELTNLCIYVLAGFNKDESYSSESALRYFILGALSSAIMLFGFSIIYGFTGHIDFTNIMLSQKLNSLPILFAITMIFAGIFFKLAASPFHLWVLEVYEGAPMFSVALFASIVKISIVILLIKLTIIFKHIKPIFYMIGACGMISLIVGALGALRQNSIKRIIAYSGIFNIGFILFSICSNNQEGFVAGINYTLIYSITLIGIISLLIYIYPEEVEKLQIDQLKGSIKGVAGLILTALIFSLIGIPPFAGFYAKFNVIKVLFLSNHYYLALSLIAFSVIAAFYYLKIIKGLYLIEVPINNKVREYCLPLITTSAICFAIILFYVLRADILLDNTLNFIQKFSNAV